jgi:hypothetical protein
MYPYAYVMFLHKSGFHDNVSLVLIPILLLGKRYSPPFNYTYLLYVPMYQIFFFFNNLSGD